MDEQKVVNPASSTLRQGFNKEILLFRVVVSVAIGVFTAILLAALGVFALPLLPLAMILVMLFLLHGRPRMFYDCPECGKRIASNESWICGYCDKIHDRSSKLYRSFQATFFEMCRCGKEAESYRCHHCGGMLFLGKERDCTHPARHAYVDYTRWWDRDLQSRLPKGCGIRTRKISKGGSFVVILALNPTIGRITIFWWKHPRVKDEIRVVGYVGKTKLFNEQGDGNEGGHSEVWEPGAYPCKFEVYPPGPLTSNSSKIDEVEYLLAVPKREEAEKEVINHVDKIIAEFDQVGDELIATEIGREKQLRRGQSAFIEAGFEGDQLDWAMNRLKARLRVVK